MFVPKYLVNCNAYQPSFQFPLCFSYEDVVEKDDISRTVKEVVEEVNIFKYIDFSQNNAHGYDAIQMFEAVILAFAINGYASLRDLEKLCKYDIRFKFIMNGSTPSHMAFERFIKDKLTMPIEDIFVDINKYIEAHDVIDTEVLYIDGTKFEANANKMTFVWMKATKKFREKRWIKVMDRLSAFNKYCSKNNLNIRFSIVREINFDYLFEVVSVIEQLMAKNSIQVVHGKGKKKHELQRYQEAFKEDALKMFKYTIYSDIAGDRNSFSKTDPDATFMHMKYDYYNHTNVFKPGYNVQVGSSDGYIRHVYVSSDVNDCWTSISIYQNEHCEGCPFKSQCTKSKTGRTIQRCRKSPNRQKEVKESLSTEQGKKYMTQREYLECRNLWTDMKEDNHYDKLRRRGISGVKLEILLVCIGHNLRRYHTRKLEFQKNNKIN